VEPDPPSQTSPPTQPATATPITWPQSQIPQTQTLSGGIQFELQDRKVWRAGVLKQFDIACKVLAARFIVMIALLGGIGLTFVTLHNPNQMQLYAMGIYGLMVGACVWLASRSV